MDKITPEHLYEAYRSGSLSKNDAESIKTLIKEHEYEYSYAESIFNNNRKREILEAFLLTGETNNNIAKILDIPLKVIDIYSKIFFDKSVFKDKLDIEEYIETYDDDYGKNLKLCAVTLGIKYLKFRYGYSETDLDITAILESIVESANILASAARINPLNSTVSREARQWVSTTIKAIEALSKVKVKTDDKDTDEWQLILEELSNPQTEQTEDIGPDDIVH